MSMTATVEVPVATRRAFAERLQVLHSNTEGWVTAPRNLGQKILHYAVRLVDVLHLRGVVDALAPTASKVAGFVKSVLSRPLNLLAPVGRLLARRGGVPAAVTIATLASPIGRRVVLDSLYAVGSAITSATSWVLRKVRLNKAADAVQDTFIKGLDLTLRASAKVDGTIVGTLLDVDGFGMRTARSLATMFLEYKIVAMVLARIAFPGGFGGFALKVLVAMLTSQTISWVRGAVTLTVSEVFSLFGSDSRKASIDTVGIVSEASAQLKVDLEAAFEAARAARPTMDGEMSDEYIKALAEIGRVTKEQLALDEAVILARLGSEQVAAEAKVAEAAEAAEAAAAEVVEHETKIADAVKNGSISEIVEALGSDAANSVLEADATPAPKDVIDVVLEAGATRTAHPTTTQRRTYPANGSKKRSARKQAVVAAK